MKIDFLTSTRFWGLFILAVLKFLVSQGIVPPDIFQALEILILGYIGVRTIDKTAKAVGGIK